MAATFNLYQETLIGDRAFNYGDGCFTTMLCVDQNIQLLAYHLARLEHDTCKLHIPFTATDKAALSAALSDISSKLHHGIIKIHISRGTGGRGYGVSGVSAPNITLTQHTIPPHFSKPVSLSIASFPISRQPALAGTKHISRVEQVLFKRCAEELGTTDVICLDEFQHVIETSSANLFWYKDNQWFTPDLNDSGVAGTFRACILDTLDTAGAACEVGSFPLSALLAAESVFMCNAVRGIVRVDKVIVHEDPVVNATAVKECTRSIEFDNSAVSILQNQVALFLATHS